MILIDAVKDLLSHVCSAAEKTTISDFVAYFTNRVQQSHNQTVAAADTAAIDANLTTDNKPAVNDPEKTLTSDTCSSDENAKDVPTEISCRAEEIDVKDAEVAAADADESVNDAVKEECNWKLFIKVHSRNKKMSHRFEQVDVMRSLRDNLVRRMIVEYPTLHICSSQNHC